MSGYPVARKLARHLMFMMPFGHIPRTRCFPFEAESCSDFGCLGSPSNLTVDQTLEDISMDWQGEVIPGTTLADYGTNLDGFSRT